MTVTVDAPTGSDRHTLRLDVEAFLYEEAAMLDEWRLDEWLTLLTPDSRYEVPATNNPSGQPADSLMLISDDHAMTVARIKRLNSRKAHREFPWSRTTRIVGNVRIVSTTAGAGGDELQVSANFAVYRSRKETVAYVGRYTYRLVPSGDSYLIRFRRAVLDSETLDAHGTLSIVL
jgi:p-cumate 2,3-dioxygenase beta subunit